MELVQLIIPAEAAHDAIGNLGELGMLQLKDLNSDKSPFQRTYANHVKRCDEMARKLRFFKAEIQKASMSASIVPASPSDASPPLDELETKLERLERELIEMNSNTDKLRKSQAELVELQMVLEQARKFFEEARTDADEHQREVREAALESQGSDATPLMEKAEPNAVRLGFITGLIPTERINSFERILFRATRGNMFLRTAPIDGKVVDPSTGEKMQKTVFIVFFAGERARTKITKICEAFNANRYPFPEDIGRQRQLNTEVNARLSEIGTTVEAGNKHRFALLREISAQCELWDMKVKKEKAIYHALNMLSIDVTRMALVAEGWCPAAGKKHISDVLDRAATSSSSTVSTIFRVKETKEKPPTFFRTNKFTYCFQEIINAYGVANYREANPGVFTIITFPFLFAVMFGDFGHGILLLLFALYLVLNEKKLGAGKLNEMVGMAFGGRYCILLMAAFSIYTGLLYNECFSCPMSIFKSGWNCDVPEADSDGCENTDKVYPIGVDPAWHGTRTELPFMNSLKMKMSIIMGVIQMNLGIITSSFNHRYFGDRLSLICEFIPQMLFLGCLFGYLSLLIIIKWLKSDGDSGFQADLYGVMIDMFLSPGELADGNELIPGQAGIQVILVLVALASVPWMLIPKPYILKKRHERRQHYSALQDQAFEEELGGQMQAEDDGHAEEFNFGDIMVHQMIHTIEFVLGAISNTASYLRLWALSLAHAQLSASRVRTVGSHDWLCRVGRGDLGGADGDGNAECVLARASFALGKQPEQRFVIAHMPHVAKVEYMNKFYKGEGYRFVPFSFADLLAEEDE
eukprot:scaffold866_cov544-Prasinococcus_capsulatus_cf.AAC.9